MAMLIARSVLPEEAIVEATGLLNEARMKASARENGTRQGKGEGEGEEAGKKRATTGGCCAACGDPVAVPAMVVCANKVCFSFVLSIFTVAVVTTY